MFFSPGSGDDVPRAPRSLRVLIADDNRDQVLTLTALLCEAGHEVHGVHGGQEAIDAAREFKPDVCLIDIGMPKVSGYDVARAIRKRHGERIALIAVTAYAGVPDKLAALAAGFHHHVAKPFDPDKLLDLLQQATSPTR